MFQNIGELTELVVQACYKTKSIDSADF